MKKLYLIVNPEGGAKKGLDILERVEPIFSEADIELTLDAFVILCLLPGEILSANAIFLFLYCCYCYIPPINFLT